MSLWHADTNASSLPAGSHMLVVSALQAGLDFFSRQLWVVG